MALANSDLFWYFILKDAHPEWLDVYIKFGIVLSSIVTIMTLVMFIYMAYKFFND